MHVEIVILLLLFVVLEITLQWFAFYIVFGLELDFNRI